jgi:ectoine hydroxylase
VTKTVLVEPSAIERFRRDGYYVQRGFVDRPRAEEASRWLAGQDPDELAKSWTEREPGVPLAVFSVVHEGDHPVARLARDPRVLEFGGALMGAPVYLWASKVNVKAAWCGAVEYYHQDLIYWKNRGYRRNDLLTCMVFLEPHTVRNAALHIMPGTHRIGIIEHAPFININGLAKSMVPPATLSRLQRTHGLVAIEGEPGDAVFFHAGVVHGSSHNISPQPRSVVISQLNVVGNEPVEVESNAREFNLQRSEFELREAERRLAWFRRKRDEQQAATDVTFAAPIPEHERKP